MKIILLLSLLVFVGCQAKSGGEEGIFENNQPISNTFTVTTALNDTYKSGENIDFNFAFPVVATVTGTPEIDLTIGAATVVATYVSGTGTTNLTFRYTVQGGDTDANGIAIDSTINLNGGTLKYGAGPSDCSLTITPPTLTTVLVDTTAPTLTSVTAPSNASYGSTQAMNFTAAFSEAVVVTGTPRIAVDVGGVTRYATYLSGSGTASLVFRYTVVVSEVDANGIDVTSPMQLNAGTITDVATNNLAALTFTPPITTSVLVDGVAPTITGASGPANATYFEAQNLNFVLTFSENVTFTGTPRVQLTVGSDTFYATYFSGSGTNSITFRYVVQSGDTDLDGIASISPLELNAGTILDIANNALSPLTFTPPNTTLVNVDANGASILSVTPPANTTYKTTNNLDFIVNYTRPVDITGTPRIQLNVGGATLYANYLSGTGTAAITFRYTVGVGAADADGIATVSPIQLNSGTIKDSNLDDAGQTFTLPNTALVYVDGLDIVIDSINPPANATYKIGDNLDFTINYNYAATITGSPRIQLTVGAATLYATYVSGSGSTAHLMRYTVSSGDVDTNGIDTVSNLNLNGGTVKDAFGDNATLTFTGANYANKKVDGIRPTISNMTASANATYKVGATIDFTTTYSEIVNITGSPQLTLTVGAATRYAVYQSGTGSTSIVFRYTVLAGDLDANGIAASGTVDLNSGTIKDVPGNDQTNLAYTPPTLTGVLVDGVVPTISSVSPPGNQTFGNTANINFTVNFSEIVNVTGSPTLSLNIGGASKNATYFSGTGSTAIVFRYTTVTNDVDTNGIDSSSPLLLAGGTIRDAALNDATLTFTGANYALVLVDALAPAVSSVTLPADNTYQNGGARPTLSFTVVYNEIVNVASGTPRIHLTIGSTLRYATYASGTGSTSLVFSYSVAAADLDLDSIAIANSNNIDLNGATIRDALLNNASVAMGSNSTVGIFAVLPSMRSWYDLTDAAHVTTGGGNITALLDKIGTFNYTHTGIPYFATGFNGGVNGYASCASASAFVGASTTTPVALVAVFRAPPNTTTQYLFQATTTANRPMIQFTSTATNGTVNFGGTVLGSVYDGGAWGAAAGTDTNAWPAINGYYARGFWWSTTQTRIPSLCKMTGQLAETFIFTSQPSVGDMTAISAYLNTRYGLAFP